MNRIIRTKFLFSFLILLHLFGVNFSSIHNHDSDNHGISQTEVGSDCQICHHLSQSSHFLFSAQVSLFKSDSFSFISVIEEESLHFSFYQYTSIRAPPFQA